jgi:hypothetical protein
MLNYLESWNKISKGEDSGIIIATNSGDLPDPPSSIGTLIGNHYNFFRTLKAHNNYKFLLNRINNSLVYPVPSDGNCLYSSFSLSRALETPLQQGELTYAHLINRMNPFDIRRQICQSENNGGHRDRATLENTDYNTIQKSLSNPLSGKWGFADDLQYILDDNETIVFINVLDPNWVSPPGQMTIVTNQSSSTLVDIDPVTRQTSLQEVSTNLQEGRRVHIILSYGHHFAPLINNPNNHPSIPDKPMIALTYNNNVGGKKKKTKRKKRKVAKKKTINKRKK